MSNPVPKRLRDEFVSYMEANDLDDLSDGAWFRNLEVAAERFLAAHRLRGDENDAAHQYLRMCEERSNHADHA